MSEPLYTHLDIVPGCASYLESLSEDMKGKKRHPVAEGYFQDYRSKRSDLAWEIFHHFNATVCNYKLDLKNTRIYFNNQMWNKVGYHDEDYDDQEWSTKISSIYLSTRCLDNPERLRDALLHELCHAAVWQVDCDFENDEHGPKWKLWIQLLLCMHPYINMNQIVEDAYYKCNKYLYECVKCGYDIGEKKKLPKKYRKRCMKCGWRFRLVKLHDPKSATSIKIKRPAAISSSSRSNSNTTSEPVYTHLDIVPGCSSFLDSLSMDMKGKKRHPAAQEYFLDYRSKRSDLAWRIFENFNATVSNYKIDPSKIELYFNNQMWDDLGMHDSYRDELDTKHCQKVSKIYLSIRLLNNPEHLRDTLLHELCHAAVWHTEDAYEMDHHGPKFFWWVQHLEKIHPYVNISEETDVTDYERGKYLYECVKCGYDVGENHPLPKKYRKRCMKCGWRLRLVKHHYPDFSNLFEDYVN